jgi:acetylornithine deacetylase
MKKHIELLIQLIKTPSLSREEADTAEIIHQYLGERGIEVNRYKNNIISIHPGYDERKPTILLNSHHDTVKANKGWKRDPHGGEVEGDVIYGLGSNDAGGCLVSLIETYVQYYDKELPFNLVLAATAEEEIFGENGLGCLFDGILPRIDMGIIGEPTSLQCGVAEKGLMVCDGVTHGVSGHAARKTGINAIYKAMKDIQFIENLEMDKVSPFLGPVTYQVTQIEAGYQHNVIPDTCKYVMDIRINEMYSNYEILDFLKKYLKAEITPRSMRWNSKGIALDHPLVKSAVKAGLETMGSPTLSDQMNCYFPTIKLGPGDSRRSHTADEYIKLSEIEAGIETYIRLINELKTMKI